MAVQHHPVTSQREELHDEDRWRRQWLDVSVWVGGDSPHPPKSENLGYAGVFRFPCDHLAAIAKQSKGAVV